jgi:hypothetical protein
MLGLHRSIRDGDNLQEHDMPTRHLSVPISGNEAAVLSLPQPLTLDALADLERGLAGSLGALRREMDGSAEDPGALEYESWMDVLLAQRRCQPAT